MKPWLYRSVKKAARLTCAGLLLFATQIAQATPPEQPPVDDEVGWHEPGAEDPAQAALDQAIEDEMAASEQEQPDADPAWDTVPLGEDFAAIELAPESSLMPQLSPDLMAAPQCFVAEPVLSLGDTSVPGATCGLLPLMSLAVPTAIQDPSGGALDHFHSALARARRGEGQARIAFYGASHVAADLYTGRLRNKLIADVGSAGPGFFLPARPWKAYRNEGVSVERSRGFFTRRIMAKHPIGDAYGLAGVAFDAAPDRQASAAFTINRSAVRPELGSKLELYYWQRPRGGTLQVFVDGVRRAKVSSAGAAAQAAYAHVELPIGAQRIELRTLGDGAVRIFGVSLEQGHAGVVLDTLGIPGSRARYQLMWEDSLYREHLAHRNPDLVVLAYGTNESGDDSPLDRYEAELHKVIARVREVTPNASCLLIGPSDRPVRLPNDMFASRPRTAAIIEAQRRVAAELGCGFFDVVEFMGGPMSMVRWVRSALGTPDHVHFTRAGYERMADVLYEALMQPARIDGVKLASTPVPVQTRVTPTTQH